MLIFRLLSKSRLELHNNLIKKTLLFDRLLNKGNLKTDTYTSMKLIKKQLRHSALEEDTEIPVLVTLVQCFSVTSL